MNYVVPSPSLALLLLIISLLSTLCSTTMIHLAVSYFCYIYRMVYAAVSGVCDHNMHKRNRSFSGVVKVYCIMKVL
jgi:ABC-type proline/glycine betaine transport system permease subunit